MRKKLHKLDATNSEISQDRRARRRYPLDLQLHFKVFDGYRVLLAGTGQTVDMSSNGIAFLGDRPLDPGTFVELSINWPVLLNNSRPLRLVVAGKVVRMKDGAVAIKTDRYEFRTQGSTDLNSMRAPLLA